MSVKVITVCVKKEMYNMKRYLSALLALTTALTLTACAASASGGIPEEESAAASSAPLEDSPQPDVSQPGAPDHSHQPAEADNIVPHDPVGYCGNTITKVSSESRMGGEDWEISFWGDDSVTLTDLLLHLDYSGDICRCLPEYYVDTEFSEEAYGVNLSDSYARHGGGQVKLTEAQVELIRDILDRNLPD